MATKRERFQSSGLDDLERKMIEPALLRGNDEIDMGKKPRPNPRPYNHPPQNIIRTVPTTTYFSDDLTTKQGRFRLSGLDDLEQEMLRGKDKDMGKMPRPNPKPCTVRTIMYIPDDASADASQTFSMCLRDAANAPTNMLCGLYASAIIIMAPTLKDTFVEVMAEHRMTPEEVKIPSECGVRLVDPTPARYLSPAQVTILWGASILLLFKNVAPENYHAFMNKRMSALKARVGSDPDDVLGLPFGLDSATNIRGIFGANNLLRRRVVEFIIANGEGREILSRCCPYLKGLLAWSEMHAFKVIYDMLFLPGSRILRDPRVQAEVEAVNEAYHAIMNHEYPPFFRFFGPDDQQYLLDRSRFPTLITVAVAIKMKYYPSFKNFVTPLKISDNIIKSLMKLHALDLKEPVKVSAMHRFLMKNYVFD